MMHVKTNGVTMHITGPNSDGEYWLHLSGSGESCGFNLGRPMGMVSTALLMAASVKFGPAAHDASGKEGA